MDVLSLPPAVPTAAPPPISGALPPAEGLLAFALLPPVAVGAAPAPAAIDDDVPPADESALVPLLLGWIAAAQGPTAQTESAQSPAADTVVRAGVSAVPGAGAPPLATATRMTAAPMAGSPEAAAPPVPETAMAAAMPPAPDAMPASVPIPAAGVISAADLPAAVLVPDAAARAPAAPQPAPMHTPPEHPQWDEEFGDRVLWGVQRGLAQAEIRLHPQELGQVAVRIELEDGRARLHFETAQVQAAAIIEQALPRLRELFAHEGLQLAQVQVSAQSAHDHARRQDAPPPRLSAGTAAEDEPEPAVSRVSTPRHRGLLDDYA